ncbi:MAG: hypothetical protein AAFR04_16300, partial [Pseudomonadota bacterium]
MTIIVCPVIERGRAMHGAAGDDNSDERAAASAGHARPELGPDALEGTPAFDAALDFLETQTGHLFVTGRAGTGKSTLLRCIKDMVMDDLVVLGPTGLAAVNVGGQTIHSFFGFPPRLLTSDDIRRSRNGRV